MPIATSFFFQSLDYDICENSIYIEEEKRRGSLYILRKDTARWFICLATGVLVALIAAVVDIVIEQLSEYKYTMLSKCILLSIGLKNYDFLKIFFDILLM